MKTKTWKILPNVNNWKSKAFDSPTKMNLRRRWINSRKQYGFALRIPRHTIIEHKRICWRNERTVNERNNRKTKCIFRGESGHWTCDKIEWRKRTGRLPGISTTSSYSSTKQGYGFGKSKAKKRQNNLENFSGKLSKSGKIGFGFCGNATGCSESVCRHV